MKSFKEYSTLNELTNKVLGNFAVRMWGTLLYMSYGHLPSGPGNLKRLELEIFKYLRLKDDDDKQDTEEWFADGASMGGEKLLTKKLFDQLLRLNEVKVKKLFGMKVWRSGPVRKGWNSFTTNEESAKHYAKAAASLVYKLPRGTKYIETNGYADIDEIIIRDDQLPKGTKV